MRPIQITTAARIATLSNQGCGTAQQDPETGAAPPPAQAAIAACNLNQYTVP
jgi:hypothetical protein